MFYVRVHPFTLHRGTVLLDNTPLPDIDHTFLHTQVALVSQEPLLFADTLRFNICFGRGGDVTQAEVEAAAKEANAHEFIQAFPEGCGGLETCAFRGSCVCIFVLVLVCGVRPRGALLLWALLLCQCTSPLPVD